MELLFISATGDVFFDGMKKIKIFKKYVDKSNQTFQVNEKAVKSEWKIKNLQTLRALTQKCSNKKNRNREGSLNLRIDILNCITFKGGRVGGLGQKRGLEWKKAISIGRLPNSIYAFPFSLSRLHFISLFFVFVLFILFSRLFYFILFYSIRRRVVFFAPPAGKFRAFSPFAVVSTYMYLRINIWLQNHINSAR